MKRMHSSSGGGGGDSDVGVGEDDSSSPPKLRKESALTLTRTAPHGFLREYTRASFIDVQKDVLGVLNDLSPDV